MTGISQYTRTRCPDLADYLEECASAPLRFVGTTDPNLHSADNHIHLWGLEWWAERVDFVDVEYRVDFVEHIFARWRGRLTGQWPYQAAGYRLYLYEWMAPTISVVAETPVGFPYDSTHAQFVASPRDVLEIYDKQVWSQNFAFGDWDVSRERLLETIAKNSGSISQPAAAALGLKVAKLRILIEQMGLQRAVNDIRKRFGRAPARFRLDDPIPEWSFRIYERKLPAGYR